jgi:hypothetical protein
MEVGVNPWSGSVPPDSYKFHAPQQPQNYAHPRHSAVNPEAATRRSERKFSRPHRLKHIHAARRTGSGCDTTSDIISQSRHVLRRTRDILLFSQCHSCSKVLSGPGPAYGSETSCNTALRCYPTRSVPRICLRSTPTRWHSVILLHRKNHPKRDARLP